MVEPKSGPANRSWPEAQKGVSLLTRAVNAGKGEVRDSLGAQRIVDRNPSFEHLGELPLLLRAERVEVGANWRGGECGGKLGRAFEGQRQCMLRDVNVVETRPL